MKYVKCLCRYISRGFRFRDIAFTLVAVNFVLLLYQVLPAGRIQTADLYLLDVGFKSSIKHQKVSNHQVRRSLPEVLKDGFSLASYLRHQCSRLEQPNSFEFSESFFISKMHVVTKLPPSLFCAVEKVGSTYWRRVIYQVTSMNANKRQTFSNPYAVSIYQALGQQFVHLNNRTTSSDVRKYFKFMFVRNPYNRVLSAYIDKVFVPNPLFWDRFGKPAILMFRNNNTSSNLRCAHDATFTEFIKFVVWSETNRKQLDPHFLSASEMCVACSVNMTFVGKMETFETDAKVIFRRFGLNATKEGLFGPEDKQLSTKDAIDDSISSPFLWRRHIVCCIGWHEALLRIWRKLQMRGLIGMDHKYPLTFKQSQKVRVTDFKKLAYKARKESDPKMLKNQKNDVFKAMYSRVSRDVILSLRRVYLTDLRLFDYDDMPEEIFGTHSARSSYDYTDFRN